MRLNSCAFSGSCDGLLLEADDETTGRMSFPMPFDSEQAVKYNNLKMLEKYGIQARDLVVGLDEIRFLFVFKTRACNMLTPWFRPHELFGPM